MSRRNASRPFVAEALEPRLFMDSKLITSVPFYPWYYGCTPTVIGEIMGYYNQVFPNIFPGTNARTRDSIVTNLIASVQHRVAGLENGRLTFDGKTAGAGDWENSPSYPNHAANPNCIADFIKTIGGNVAEGNIIPGILNFLNWRGYTGWHVNETYFSVGGFQDIVNSINEGRPVMAIVDLLGEGRAAHSAPIVGYNTANQTFAVVDNSTQGLPGSTYTLQWAHWGPVTVGQKYGILSYFNIQPPIVTNAAAVIPANVPGTIQAENFDNGLLSVGSAAAGTGVGIQPTSDTGGGYQVGFTKAGESLSYALSVPGDGPYDVSIRVSNTGDGGRIHLALDGSPITTPIAVPNTGSWDTWQTITVKDVAFLAGQHTLTLSFDANSSNRYDGNYNWLQFTPGVDTVPAAPTGLSAAGSSLGDVHLTWNVSTGTTGYDIFRSTSNDPTTAGSPIGSVTGLSFDDLTAGPDANDYYWIEARNSAGSSPLGTPFYAGSTPFSGTPIAVPATIQAENFDLGGEGIAYHDTSTFNQGRAYRTSEAVGIEATTDTGGGYNVGYIQAGEWLKYSVKVPTAGTYALDFRVASSGTGGTFHLEVDGTDVTGAMTIPNTGGWQKWATITQAGVSLSAGRHVMRLVFDSNGTSGFVGNVNWLKVR